VEGAPELVLGLPPGFRNHIRSGWIGVKLEHLLYLMLPSLSPFSKCKNSKWKWLLDVGVLLSLVFGEEHIICPATALLGRSTPIRTAIEKQKLGYIIMLQ
jgi:hypothetical protein